ncbi:MAG: SLC13 family permease, partial [Acidobacteriota bacterium]|nr:SLC13 family permease [Acidobacteriota bacterium]
YLSIIGGTCTLIGTSTNLLVASMSAQYGFGAFSMFEFLALGLILLVVGFAYIVLVPMRRLPDRAGASDLTTKYQLSSFLTEVQVPEGSSLVGSNVVDAHINERFRLTVLEILRGEERIAVELRATPMQGGDLLIVEGRMDDIVSFRDHYGLRLRTETKIGDRDLSDKNNIMAEIQLSPVSRITGSTIRELDFRRRFGCFVLALNRTGEPIREKLAHVFGPRSRIEALYETEDFIPLQQDVKLRLVIPRRWWLAVVIIPIVVVVAATGVTSILKASILGAVALIVFGGISVQQAYEAINWTVIFLLVGILPMGIAMEKTGLAAMIGETIANAGADYGPWAVIALVYLATALLSEIVSNNSTAVLMVP